MPELEYEGRTLVYTEFGAGARRPGRPTYVFMSTEYRDTTTILDFYNLFPADIGGVVLDNTNMGQSSRLDRPLSTDEIIAEVRHACRVLGIERPIFVGYCSTAELAMRAAVDLDGAGVVLHGPLIRINHGGFVEFLYAAMKKGILTHDPGLLCVVMNLIDPHCKGFLEERNYAMSDQFTLAVLLKDADHFWIKTQQNKPTGLFDWERLPEFDKPLLIIKGAHDPLQPVNWLKARITRPQHRLEVLDCGHKVLDERRDEVIALMSEFARSPALLRVPVEA